MTRMNLIRVFICVVIFQFIGINLVRADAFPDKFEQANELYFQNKFNQAEKIYLELLDEYPENSTLNYNLGNIYARQDKLGLSIYHYLKAYQKSPRDSDLRANLNYVNSLAKQEEDNLTIGKNRVFNFFYFWTDYLTLKENLWLSITIWNLFLALSIVFILRKKRKRVALIFLGIASYFILGASFDFFQKLNPIAVVVHPHVKAQVNFLDQEKVLKELNEGELLKVLSIQKTSGNKSWVQIELPNLQKAWVEKKFIKII